MLIFPKSSNGMRNEGSTNSYWQNGASIVEVMVAATIFLIIMLGGIQYFYLPQSTLVHQKTKRLAISTSLRQMEKILALKYSEITPALNQSSQSIVVGKMPAEKTVSILEVDDPADGQGVDDADGETVDYKQVQVSITWSNGKENINLATAVSQYAGGN